MPEPDPDDLLAPADALAARLSSVPKLAGVPVIVDRQKDIDAEIAKAVAKAKGAAIIISLEGWDSAPGDSGSALLPLVHSVSIWATPVMKALSVPQSVALGAMVRAIHAWRPPGSRGPMYRWRVGPASYGEVKKGTGNFRVYEFSATYEVIL